MLQHDRQRPEDVLKVDEDEEGLGKEVGGFDKRLPPKIKCHARLGTQAPQSCLCR
jgi:hypothetical protein